jgi:hypothetical protein
MSFRMMYCFAGAPQIIGVWTSTVWNPFFAKKGSAVTLTSACKAFSPSLRASAVIARISSLPLLGYLGISRRLLSSKTSLLKAINISAVNGSFPAGLTEPAILKLGAGPNIKYKSEASFSS